MSNLEQKSKHFLEGRMMAHTVPENVLIEMIVDGMEKYLLDRDNKDNRRKVHQVMMLLTMKWGDEENNRDSEDIIKDTERLERISSIDENMSSVDDILNPDKDGS